MFRKRRFAALALVLVAGLGIWFFAMRPKPEPAPAYTFATVEQGPIVSAVSTSGRLQAADSVVVGSQLSGQISELLVDYNSRVKAGDLLARIDPKTFEARVKQAEAQLEVAKARVVEAEAQLRRAELNRAEAGRDFERRRALRDQGNLSERDFDVAQTRMETTQTDAQLAAAQIANAKAAVLQQQAALLQAQIDLDRTYITAPIDGVVISRSVESGQTVAASLSAPELFTIASTLTLMEVEARVDEADIGRVRPGQPVRFTVDAFPGRTFRGEVTQIQKSPQEVQSVVTYTVLVSAANPDERLLPGLTAKLDIVLGEKPDALKIPAQALRFRPRDGQGPGGPGGGGQRPPPPGAPGAAVAAQPSAPGTTAQAGAQPQGAAQGPGQGQGQGQGQGRPRGDGGAGRGGPGGELPDGVSRGVVFILGEDGQPKPMPVLLGLSDADWAEMVKGELKPDDKVIVRAGAAGGPQQQNRAPGLRF